MSKTKKKWYHIIIPTQKNEHWTVYATSAEEAKFKVLDMKSSDIHLEYEETIKIDENAIRIL